MYTKRSQFLRKFLALLALLLAFSSLKADLTSGNQLDWENKETEKLLSSALEHVKKGRTNHAIQELSEIIEFFPESKHWSEACTKLCELHLLNKNTDASHELLQRLRNRRKPDEKTSSMVLFANWDYYGKQGLFKELSKWLKTLSKEDYSHLRRDDALIPRLSALSSKTEVEQLLEVYQTLGYKDPLAEVLALINRKEFSFDKDKQVKILNKLILLDNHLGISQMSRIMSKDGWNNLADEVFLKHSGDKEPKWLRVWVNLLIDGKLWKQALRTLKRYPSEEYKKDLVLIHTGLKNYQQAYQIIRDSKKWIYSTLSLDDIIAIIDGLGRESFSQNMKDDLLKNLPDGDKKVFINASLENDIKKQLATFQKIAKTSSLYADQAWFEIANIHYKERKSDELAKILKTVKENYPKSVYISKINTLLTTLTSIENKPQKTEKKSEAKKETDKPKEVIEKK